MWWQETIDAEIEMVPTSQEAMIHGLCFLVWDGTEIKELYD